MEAKYIRETYKFDLYIMINNTGSNMLRTNSHEEDLKKISARFQHQNVGIIKE
jgi:hypothetical protein